GVPSVAEELRRRPITRHRHLRSGAEFDLNLQSWDKPRLLDVGLLSGWRQPQVQSHRKDRVGLFLRRRNSPGRRVGFLEALPTAVCCLRCVHWEGSSQPCWLAYWTLRAVPW